MKIMHLKPQIIFIFLYLMLISASAHAAGSSKIIVYLTEDRSQEQSSYIKNVETMLSKHLIQSGFQVVSADDLKIIADLNSEEIRDIAIAHNAGLIFKAQIKTEISSQETYGIQIKKAVSSISYKLLETETGHVLAVDTGQYTSGAKTAEQALHLCFQKMISDIGPVITVKSYYQLTAINPRDTNKPAQEDNTETRTRTKINKNTRPVLWGLVIGVSKYANQSANLKYADKDALSISDFLNTQNDKLFTEVKIKTLTNDQVTRESIIRNMSTHLNKAGPDDVVFIFIAGHGIKYKQTGTYYFIPHDADLDSLLSKGMRMSDFEESVKIISQNVNKVILVMDTCQSGSLEINARALDTGDDLIAAMKETSGLFILSASKGGEYALEDRSYKLHENDTGHGAFTYALIKGMSGHANYDKDNYISLNEIFQYVSKQVPRITNGQQHPYFRTHGTDVPFILVKGLE